MTDALTSQPSHGSETPTQLKPFMVLATVRSGSYNLVSLLDSAPDLVCHGEIYKSENIELPKDALLALGLRRNMTQERDARGAKMLEELQALSAPRPMGFKVFPRHIRQRPFLGTALHSGRFRVITLMRPVLEICVSATAAEQTGAYTRSEDTPLKEVQVSLSRDDIDRTISFVGGHRTLARKLRKADHIETLNLTYRQSLRPKGLNRALAFLGSTADAKELRSEYAPQSVSGLEERVSNWEEVVEYVNSLDRTDLLEEAGFDRTGLRLAER